MQEKIITDVLREAVRIEGSSQALASRLRAPETTLARWVAGRAQTPLRAFLAALDMVMKDEAQRALAEAGDASAALEGEPLRFRLGPLEARCARCDATTFARVNGPALRLTSVLKCASCGTPAVHGNLLAQLARDAVQHSRASVARGQRVVQSLRKGTPN